MFCGLRRHFFGPWASLESAVGAQASKTSNRVSVSELRTLSGARLIEADHQLSIDVAKRIVQLGHDIYEDDNLDLSDFLSLTEA